MYLFNGICSKGASVEAVTFPIDAVLLTSARSIEAGVLLLLGLGLALKLGFNSPYFGAAFLCEKVGAVLLEGILLLLFPKGSTGMPLSLSFFL